MGVNVADDQSAILNTSEPDAKQRLLTAAQEVFAHHGYEGASVRQICTLAGVNIAGVNYHFGDKEHLYIEAVKQAHSCMNSAQHADEPAGTPPAVKLEQLIRGMAPEMHAPASPIALQLVMRELANPGKAASVVVEEFIRPVAQRLWGILEELLPAQSEQDRMMLGFSIISQCLFYRQNRPVTELLFGKAQLEALDSGRVAEHIVQFVFRALDIPIPSQQRVGG